MTSRRPKMGKVVYDGARMLSTVKYKGMGLEVDDPKAPAADVILTKYGAYPNTLAGLYAALEKHRGGS